MKKIENISKKIQETDNPTVSGALFLVGQSKIKTVNEKLEELRATIDSDNSDDLPNGGFDKLRREYKEEIRKLKNDFETLTIEEIVDRFATIKKLKIACEQKLKNATDEMKVHFVDKDKESD